MSTGTPEARTIYVSNVKEEVTKDHLDRLFSSAGVTEEVSLMEGEGAEAIWQIVFETEAEAKHALLMNMMQFAGLPIEVRSKQQVLQNDAAEERKHSTALTLADEQDMAQISLAALQQSQGPTQAQKDVYAGVPGAGITPQLIEMIKEHPDRAKQLIPLIQQNPTASAGDLGILNMLTEFHANRASQAAELRAAEQKAELERKVEDEKRRRKELEAQISKLERLERERKRERKRSSSAHSSPETRPKKKPRKSSDDKVQWESKSVTPTPGPPNTTPEVDKDYATDKESRHIYIVYPASLKAPPMATVRPIFEKLGTLTDLKVSKSKNSVFASIDKNVSDADLEKLQSDELFKGTAVQRARTAYGPYLKSDKEGTPPPKDKPDQKREPERSEREREDRDRRDRDRRDRDRRDDRDYDRRDRDRRDDRDRDRRGGGGDRRDRRDDRDDRYSRRR